MQVFVVGSFVVACSVKVARLPRAGESLDAEAFVSEPGGKGFNLALATRRLGAEVAGLFAIGDDAFAVLAEAAFERARLSPAMLVRRHGATGAGIGFVDALGENCLAVSLGANRLLGAGDVAERSAEIDRCDLVMASLESPDAAIAAAFSQARRRGIRTLLNPSPTRTIDPTILANTTILVANRVEAETLGIHAPGAETHEQALRVMGEGPETIVVTLGPEGALAFRRDETPLVQPAFRVKAVDTIGAGDAFSAGLAVGLLQGRALPEALARASACGAMAACRLGAFDAFPTDAELEAFLVRQRS